jgi:GTP cyclohydrolase IA
MRISFSQISADSKLLAEKIKASGNTYEAVFGIPAGGLVTGHIVSEILDIPQLSLLEYNELKGKGKVILVVDDLIDGGGTIKKFTAGTGYDVGVVYKKDKSPMDLIKYHIGELNNEWVDFPHEKSETGIEEHLVRVLEFIGEDANREGLVDTPKRVAKMYGEIFRGYKAEQKPTITIFENGKDGVFYDQMIIDTGDFYSHCEHHIVPFFGQYWFAYIPGKKIIGLSKVARIVDYYSAKLQVQERLVKEIVDAIEAELEPKGIALIMQGEHLCKTMRGAKKKGKMITSDLRGVFKDPTDISRAEFLNLIKL